jgi:acyl carrier protein
MLGDSPNAIRLRALVAEILRIPAATINERLDMEATSTWDSLSHMELIAAIEDEFQVELTSDEIITMTSVATIATVLRAKSVSL